MPRRPRPVFEWPLDGQPLTFEVVVRGSACCLGYTAPPRRGVRTGERWYHGQRFHAVRDVSDHRDFVTVLTTGGSYVNVWAKYNRRGEPVGVVFAVPVNNRQPGEAQKGGLAPRPPPVNNRVPSRSRSRLPRQAPTGAIAAPTWFRRRRLCPSRRAESCALRRRCLLYSAESCVLRRRCPLHSA